MLQDGHEVGEGGGVVQLLAQHLEHGGGALGVHVHRVEPNRLINQLIGINLIINYLNHVKRAVLPDGKF